MTDNRHIKFATDLVTYYAPSFWGGEGGLDQITDVIANGQWDPLRFWERILDCTQEAGLDGIEMTFPPGDWHSAQAAYGTAHGFAAALKDRGLLVCSGFLPTEIPGTNLSANFADPADHDRLVDMATAYAEFLHGCGSEIMVTALPIRKSRDTDPPLFVDLKLAETIAGVLNRMGYATLKYGVKLAVHPEAFTMFRNSRDVDLFMLLTDPTYVSLCPDTAQFTVAGSNPIEIVKRHRDRLLITHWKDAVGPAPEDVPIDDTIFARQIQWFAPVGTGVVDWPEWMRLLRDVQYQGWAVFELDTASDPVSDLTKIKTYVEGALLPIYR
jgi:sugar phosphate isomerase/epimerase